MSPAKTRRGRPKGTGINDGPILEEIASLIAADPALKPTTAIKVLGVSDPSTIRRLRDKYKTVTEKRPLPSTTQSSESRPVYNGENQRENRAIALDAYRDHRMTEPVRPVSAPRERATATPSTQQKKKTSTKGDTEPGRKPKLEGKPKKRPLRKPKLELSEAPKEHPPLPTPYAAALSAWQESIRAYQEASNIQIAMTRQLINSPGMQMFLQQQLMASQMMLSLMPKQSFFPTAAAFLAGHTKR